MENRLNCHAKIELATIISRRLIGGEIASSCRQVMRVLDLPDDGRPIGRLGSNRSEAIAAAF